MFNDLLDLTVIISKSELMQVLYFSKMWRRHHRDIVLTFYWGSLGVRYSRPHSGHVVVCTPDGDRLAFADVNSFVPTFEAGRIDHICRRLLGKGMSQTC